MALALTGVRHPKVLNTTETEKMAVRFESIKEKQLAML
jgi:hypothetical protein